VRRAAEEEQVVKVVAAMEKVVVAEAEVA